MANERLYVKNGKVRTVNAISVVINGIRYANPNEEIAASLGFDSVDALLASCGWELYAPEEVAVTLEQAIEAKVRDIEIYDQSSAVRRFVVNGEETWLDKTDRISMRNLYTIQQSKEQAFATMWLNGKAYTLVPIADAIEILNKLELYAGETNNVTQSHIAYVRESKSVAEAESFDITADYPSVVEITL